MEDIIRGNWFSNYLFMWGGDAYKPNLEGVTVFLDTPLIISLLGFHGRLSEKVISELVKLLNDLKAKVRIFSHNLEETQSVLRGWARAIISNNCKNMRIEVLQEIHTKQYDSNKLENLAISLTGFLNSLSIETEDAPHILLRSS